VKKLCLLLFFLAGLTFLVFSAGSKEKQIDIYYSSSLNGNLDGCDCKGNPRSGLVKRAVFLRTINKKSSILLEAGDIFDVYEDKLLSDYILKSYLDLGYDAIAVGDQEFSNGTEYLFEKLNPFPLYGNNLSIRTNNGRFIKVSEDTLVVSRTELDIAIITIIDPDAFRFYPEEITKAIKVDDPDSSIKSLLEKIEVEDVDLKILLYHGSLAKARKLAEKNPAINIIITGHDQQLEKGEMVGDTIIVSPGREGNLLGYLRVSLFNRELQFNNSFISFDYMKDPDDEIIRNHIDEYNSIMTNKLKTN